MDVLAERQAACLESQFIGFAAQESTAALRRPRPGNSFRASRLREALGPRQQADLSGG
jgi:hypothetical protein